MLVPLLALNERLRCHETEVSSVPLEIGFGVAWSVVPPASETNVLEFVLVCPTLAVTGPGEGFSAGQS